MFKTVHFELFVVLIFGLGIYFMFRHHDKLEEYKNQKMKVLLVKNYELDQEQSDEEETQVAQTVGTSSMKRHEEKQKEMKRKEEELNYKRQMDKMSEEIFRNYIDCQWFTAANKGVFLIMIFFQIAMAVRFNSVIDVPTMIFVIIVFATFSLRNIMPKFYSVYTFMVVYWINFVSIVKTFYVITVQIPYIKAYRHDHKDDAGVVYSKLLFGLDFSGSSVEEEELKFGYYFLLCMILYSSHVWKQ